MTLGIFGTIAGMMMGALMGGALFGPLGAGVGLVIGSILGMLAAKAFNAGFVEQAAKQPYIVTCPDCQESIQVFLDPEEAGRAALFDGQQRVRECSRWKGAPGCERRCENQILL